MRGLQQVPSDPSQGVKRAQPDQRATIREVDGDGACESGSRLEALAANGQSECSESQPNARLLVPWSTIWVRWSAETAPGHLGGGYDEGPTRLAGNALTTGFRSVHVFEQVVPESTHRFEHPKSHSDGGIRKLHGDRVGHPGAGSAQQAGF